MSRKHPHADITQTVGRAVERGRPLEWRITETRRAVDLLNDLLADLVADARAEGQSWAQIGQLLGVTKQAATKRFGERRPAPVETGPGLF